MNIYLQNIRKSFGNLSVFDDFSLEVSEGRISCILGPSGCGKSTLLHLISGELKPEEGLIKGIDNKQIAYVFQEPRLLPWKTVRRNLEFVLPENVEGKLKSEILDHTIEMVGLKDFQHHYPAQLSGGMKQRVALARAFVYPAEILLMDEPFRGLDPALKQNLLETFRNLWWEQKRTVVFVTHDLEDAINLGGEIIILSSLPGKVIHRFTNEASVSARNEMQTKIMSLMGLSV